MPIVVGESKDRVEELIGELVDKLDEYITTPPEPPVVNVEPTSTVNVPAPVVNVAAPNITKVHPWTFHVNRDGEGRIETITAIPKT